MLHLLHTTSTALGVCRNSKKLTRQPFRRVYNDIGRNQLASIFHLCTVRIPEALLKSLVSASARLLRSTCITITATCTGLSLSLTCIAVNAAQLHVASAALALTITLPRPHMRRRRGVRLTALFCCTPLTTIAAARLSPGSPSCTPGASTDGPPCVHRL
jgi:hypothetical protein